MSKRDRSPSSMRWHSFRRYSDAVQLASVIYRGTGDITGGMKAAAKIKKYLDDAAINSWSEHQRLEAADAAGIEVNPCP